jgi:hypothetical protein
VSAGCGFYDPNGLYSDPPVDRITYTGGAMIYDGTPMTTEGDQLSPPGIPSSFGMDFVDVVLDPAANGQPLTIEFTGAPGAEAEFRVELWRLMDTGGDARPRRVPGPTAAPEVLTSTNEDGHLVYTIPAIDTTLYNRLGLIITRVDAKENLDSVGAYEIVLHPRAG